VTAEATLELARHLAESGDLALEIDETLMELLALAGNRQQVAALGEQLLQTLRRTGAAADRLGRVHCALPERWWPPRTGQLPVSTWTRPASWLPAARRSCGPRSVR
jgi:hypothetical protein